MDSQNYFNSLSSDNISEIFSHISLPDVCVIRWLCKAFYEHSRLSSFWHMYFGKMTQFEYQKVLENFSEPVVDGINEKRVDAEVSNNDKLFVVLSSMSFKNKILDRCVMYVALCNAIINNKKELIGTMEKRLVIDTHLIEHYLYDRERYVLSHYFKSENKDVYNVKSPFIWRAMGYSKSLAFLETFLEHVCEDQYITSELIEKSAMYAAWAGNLKLLKEISAKFYLPDIARPFNFDSEISRYLIEGNEKTIRDYKQDIEECVQITSQYHLVEYFNIYKTTFKDSPDESGLMWDILSTCIGYIDPDVHESLISQLHSISPREKDIRYIYKYCMEHGRDYLAHKMKLIVPDVRIKIKKSMKVKK